MKRIALMLLAACVPAVLALMLGASVGCDRHDRHRAERDRGPERHNVVIIDRDRHDRDRH